MIADDQHNEQDICLMILDTNSSEHWAREVLSVGLFKNANWYSSQTQTATVLFTPTHCELHSRLCDGLVVSV